MSVLKNELLPLLRHRVLTDEIRHQFLSNGTDAFDLLTNVLKTEEGDPRVTANALQIIRAFCIWVGRTERDQVLELAMRFCSDEAEHVREAAVSVLIGILRTNAIAPSTMIVDEEMKSRVLDSINIAVETGLGSHMNDYVGWFLEQSD